MRIASIGAGLRSLARRPGHAVAAGGTLAAAVALSVPASLLVRVESWSPPRLAPGLRASGPPPLTGGIRWGADVRTPVQLRAEELEGLLTLLLVLVAAALLACTLCLAVLLVRHLSGRRRTLAVRRAVGAAPSQLRRELLAEAGLLISGSAVLGGVVGATALLGLPAVTPSVVRPVGGFVPRPGVAALLAAAPLATVVLGYGLAGPWMALGRATLAGRARTVVAGLSAPLTPARWERGAGAALVALLALLLTGSGLLVTGSAEPPDTSASVREPDELWVSDVAVDPALPPSRRGTLVGRLAIDLRAAAAGGPSGVASAGALLGLGTRAPVLCRGCRRGPMPAPVTRVRPRIHAVAAGWSEGLGLAVIAGRSRPDTSASERSATAVVNRAFAARYGVRAGGASLQLPGRGYHQPWLRVTGVVEDVRAPGLGTPAHPAPAVYLPASAFPPSDATVAWGTAGGAPAPEDVVENLRAADGATAAPPERLFVRLAAHRAPERRARDAAALLAVVAWSIALAGLASATFLSLRRRWRELGIRRAAGASPLDVASIVLRDELRTVAVGGAVGAVLVTVEARAIARWMPDIGATETLVAFSLSLATLGLTATAAAWLPLRRAIGRPPREMISEG